MSTLYNVAIVVLYSAHTVLKIVVGVEWKHVVNATIHIKYHVYHVLKDYVLKRLQKKNFVHIVNTQGQEEQND